MPREVLIIDYCDSCFANSVKRESVETFTLGMNGSEWTYLACEEHARHVRSVLDLVEAHGTHPTPPKRRGRPPKDTQSPEEPVPCEFCPHQSPNRKAWRQHLKQRHQLTIAAYKAMKEKSA